MAISYSLPVVCMPRICTKDTMDIKDYILIINAYTESFPWSNRLISTATNFVKDDPKLAVYTEHMNMIMIDNDSILDPIQRQSFRQIRFPPPTYAAVIRQLFSHIER